MKTVLKKIKFNQFESFPELNHGISPRCFKNEQGVIEEFSFFGSDGFGETKGHSEIFLESIGITDSRLISVNQTHSDRIFVLDDAKLTENETSVISADALVTHIPGKPIGVFTADCLPILIYDPRQKVIGAIHAGRVGSEKSILFKVVREMARTYESRPEDLMVGFGPAIGVCCYEVGADCIKPFKDKFSNKEGWFRAGQSGKYFLDLTAINKIEGEKAGLLQDNIFSMDHCTCCSTSQMYSYRREGKTGRILTTIMLRR